MDPEKELCRFLTDCTGIRQVISRYVLSGPVPAHDDQDTEKSKSSGSDDLKKKVDDKAVAKTNSSASNDLKAKKDSSVGVASEKSKWLGSMPHSSPESNDLYTVPRAVGPAARGSPHLVVV